MVDTINFERWDNLNWHSEKHDYQKHMTIKFIDEMMMDRSWLGLRKDWEAWGRLEELRFPIVSQSIEV